MGLESVPVKQKKRHWGRTLCILIVCAAILLGGGYAGVTYGIPAARYYLGVSNLEKGNYAEALQQFEKLGDYRDVSVLIPETKQALEYENAALCAQRGEFLAAKEIYERLGDYRDSCQLVTEMQYLHAKSLMERGDWMAARDLFRELEDYRDSAELAVLATNEFLYAYAKECAETEKYRNAYETFEMLGDFKDSRQMTEQMYQMYQLDTAYRDAYAEYERGEYGKAYLIFAGILQENYKDTAAMLELIPNEIRDNVERFAEIGETVKMLNCLREYELFDEPAAKELREQVVAEGAFEWDDSRYHFAYNTPITRFSQNTTVEEFATLVLNMYLNGISSVTLLPQGTVPYSDALCDQLVDRFCQGADKVDELLSIHASVYNPYIWWEWQDGIFTKIRLTLEVENEYSFQQNKAHVTLARDFCEESVQAMIELGLLRNNMSHKQKAMIISEWMDFYLQYDDSQEIHNAGVAIEEQTGVCESYAALFNRMCNLVGVPTWGQIGDAGENHVWSIHLDETGNVFYSDSTWADDYDIDFDDGTWDYLEPTVEGFCQWLMTRYRISRDMAVSDEIPWPDDDMYVWSEELWSSHTAARSAEQIMEFYRSYAA